MTTPTDAQFHALHDTLRDRLASLLDLSLTLKHVHWNVVGPNFVSVHEMLDDFVDKVRLMSDALAERIRTLGGVPVGTPQAIVDTRSWKDYPVQVDSTESHLNALKAVYDGVIEDHRAAIATSGEIDPVTEDMLIGQTAELELMHWFIRSFLERGQTDASFGFASRAPSTAEEAAAERAEMGHDTPERFQEMARTGAEVDGEGSI